VSTRDSRQFELWLIDLTRGTKTRVVASDGEIFWPRWTPDNRRVAFTWRAGGTMSVAWVAADSTAAPERLVTVDSGGSLTPLSWSSDGRLLAINVLDPSGSRSISVLSLDHHNDGLRPLVNTDANEINGTFSRDGKWLAYASNETGRYEVYVEAYPAGGRKILASTAGGLNPAWHPNGRELFYMSEPDKEHRRWLMSTSFSAQPRPILGVPRPLFQATFPPGMVGIGYDVFPNGDSFLVLRPLPSPPPAPATEINVVDHWFEELKAKVPVKQ
jgi:eukaryotic-like serine/threonine-protein kinase